MDNEISPLPQVSSADGSTGNTSDLDARELRLEREKFEFEQTKFQAEQAKRSREIEKLDEEIRELRRPLWRKSSSTGAVATIAVAIVAGSLAFCTNIFNSNVFSLRARRAQLQGEVASLSRETQSLKANTSQLQEQTNALKNERAALLTNQNELTGERDSLIASTSSLRVQKAKLQEDLFLAPLRAHIDALSAHFLAIGNPLPDGDSSFFIEEFATANRGDPKVEDVFEQGFRDAKLRTAKVVLAFALFESTGEEKWRQAIVQLAADDAAGGFSANMLASQTAGYYLVFLDRPNVLQPNDKPRVLKLLYSKMVQPLPSVQYSEDARVREQAARSRKLRMESSICELVKWDKDATVGFRAPWLDCKNYLIRRLMANLENRTNQRDDNLGLYMLSPQIYAAALLQQTQVLGPTYFQDGEVIVGPSGSAMSPCPFELSMPLCRDWALDIKSSGDSSWAAFRIRYRSFPAYHEWLVENSEVVAALLDPENKVLSSVSDSTMHKLVDGIWITEEDLHK